MTSPRTVAVAPELVLDAVTAGYFDHDIVLDGVSMRVTPGKVTAVLGPNGSGKSTSLRVMSGFLVPRQGKVTLVPIYKRIVYIVSFL